MLVLKGCVVFARHLLNTRRIDLAGREMTRANSIFPAVNRIVRYDDPRRMFRKYVPDECEDNGEGYPYLWDEISKARCAEKDYRCEDCGFAYLEEGDILNVHHVVLPAKTGHLS